MRDIQQLTVQGNRPLPLPLGGIEGGVDRVCPSHFLGGRCVGEIGQRNLRGMDGPLTLAPKDPCPPGGGRKTLRIGKIAKRAIQRHYPKGVTGVGDPLFAT